MEEVLEMNLYSISGGKHEECRCFPYAFGFYFLLLEYKGIFLEIDI